MTEDAYQNEIAALNEMGSPEGISSIPCLQAWGFGESRNEIPSGRRGEP